MIRKLSFLGCVGILALGASAYAQDPSFTLGIDAPASVAGNPESDVGIQATGTLLTEGLDEGAGGAQGWSISVAADGCEIIAVTTDGTTGAEIPDDDEEGPGLRDGGFEKSELTSGDGNAGAVSAVVLSFTKPITLPPTGAAEIVALDLVGSIPALNEDGTAPVVPPCGISYIDGREGSGQPVNNRITWDGTTFDPARESASIDLQVVIDCRIEGIALAIDYSAAPTFGEDPIAEDSSRTSEVEITGSVGDKAAGSINVGIASQLPEGNGVQGWSVAIGASDELTLLGATTDDTVGGEFDEDLPDAPGKRDGGFEKTELVDAALDGQGQGCVSAVVCSFTLPITLDEVSFDTVLILDVESTDAVTEEGSAGTIQPVDGLRGSGQPVNNVATVDGSTRRFCALDQQVLSVLIKKPDIPRTFNGEGNNDARFDIADPIFKINFLFRNGPEPACVPAADSNDDGLIDLSDASFDIQYLFMGGSAPAEPGCVILSDATADNCGGEEVCAP